MSTQRDNDQVLSPAQIANSRHGPPVAAEIRWLSHDEARARVAEQHGEIVRMQVLIDELREEVERWRTERNAIAVEWRRHQDRDRLPSDWPSYDDLPEPYPNFPCSIDLVGDEGDNVTDDATVDAQGLGPEPALTRTRTVLPLASDREVEDDAWYQPTPSDEDPRGTCVRLDLDVFKDMGRPQQITVTIEPGDLLNVEDADAMDARAVPGEKMPDPVVDAMRASGKSGSEQ